MTDEQIEIIEGEEHSQRLQHLRSLHDADLYSMADSKSDEIRDFIIELIIEHDLDKES